MPRNFNALLKLNAAGTRAGLGWRAAVVLLALVNAVLLYLVVAPPGGTRSELEAQRQSLESQIAATRSRSARLRTVSSKVQTGGEQQSDFENQYILDKRTAYERLIAELQRITKASGMGERDAVYSEEPIEGTADLTLLNSAANYEGTYQNLRKFLLELDHSPVLIMLENLQAAPQQKGGQISASLRLQTIFREEPASGDMASASRGEP